MVYLLVESAKFGLGLTGVHICSGLGPCEDDYAGHVPCRQNRVRPGCVVQTQRLLLTVNACVAAQEVINVVAGRSVVDTCFQLDAILVSHHRVMSRPYGSPNLPVCLPIQLIRLYEYRTRMLRCAQNYNICWYSLFRVDLDNISNLNVLCPYFQGLFVSYHTIYCRIGLFIPFVSLEVIPGLFP